MSSDLQIPSLEKGDKTFILSPARTTGGRAQQLGRSTSKGVLARRLQSGDSVTLGEIFAFCSGLYFRGKLQYAEHFGNSERIFIITSNQGLLSAGTRITLAEFQDFGRVEIAAGNDDYRRPLEIDCAHLAARTQGPIIFLGSLASRKYTDTLRTHLPRRVLVPEPFIGLGDMARGGLLLRHVRANLELKYIPLPEHR